LFRRKRVDIALQKLSYACFNRSRRKSTTIRARKGDKAEFLITRSMVPMEHKYRSFKEGDRQRKREIQKGEGERERGREGERERGRKMG